MILKYQTAAGESVEIKLTNQPLTIGRSPKADVVLSDEKASRLHCGIRWRDKQYLLKDLESKNGTYVNNEPVESAVLKPGDKLRVGGTVFAVEPSPRTGGTTTAFHEVEKQMSGGKGYDTILKEIVGESKPRPNS